MEEDAATLLAEATGGYPYAIQLFGHYAWRSSRDADSITMEHARAAIVRAQADLADSLFAGRWHDASPKERQYLGVMARHLVDAGSATNADIAAAMGQEPKALSYLRARLVTKGTIFADDSSLRFLVPGMAAWVVEHSDDL